MRSAYREMFVALSEWHVTESTQFAAVEQGADASGDITDIRGLTESQILAIQNPELDFAIEEIRRCTSVPALQLRKQPQHLQIQPNQRHHQSERSVPLHVTRSTHARP